MYPWAIDELIKAMERERQDEARQARPPMGALRSFARNPLPPHRRMTEQVVKHGWAGAAKAHASGQSSRQVMVPRTSDAEEGAYVATAFGSLQLTRLAQGGSNRD